MKSGKLVMITMVIAALFCVAGQAQPRGGPGRPESRRIFGHPPERARHIIVGGVPYWVDAGVYYQLGDDGYVIVSAPVVRVLPERPRLIVVHGVVYYVSDNVYYRSAPGGYMVVEAPTEITPVTVVKPDVQVGTQTLYVPKKAGDGYVPVTLKKIEGGYIGPQGELYPTMPAVALLTEMYGLEQEARQERPDVFLIYVPNKDGETFTRVTLTRRNTGFVGPQGEFYPLMPTVAHLAAMYGTAKEAVKTDDAVVRIQVPRKNGQGLTEVQLKKTEQGYVGPQGELYPQMPSVDQLAEVYGGN